MKGKYFCRSTVLATSMLWASSAMAQRGGFSPDAMFERLDQDGSGVIEPEEIENSPMRGFADRMGIDISRGITREELFESMDRVRREFEDRGTFEGRAGFRGRGDADQDSSYRERFSRRGDDRDREDRGNPRSRGTTPPAPTPKPRVTLDLPQEFVAGDANHDGQIALSEWVAWKSRAALSEFLGLDRDGDGFLTPRELTKSASAQPVDVASLYQAGPVVAQNPKPDGQVPSASPLPLSTAPSEAANPSPVPPVDVQAVIASADERQVKQAERLFSVLDRNRDGAISEEEWAASRRLKPRFEKAGADLAAPMSSEQFVSYYVRIVASGDSI